MKAIAYLACFLSTVFCLNLQGIVEYDIIPMQPKDYIPNTRTQFSKTFHLTESGFVAGELGLEWGNESRGFVFHPVRGFEYINYPKAIPYAINESGLVAGIVNRSTIFIYDAELQKMIGLYEAKDLFPNHSEEFSIFQVLGISDKGHVLLRSSFFYECCVILDSLHPENPIKKVPYEIKMMNNSGEMISDSHFYLASGEKRDLGSLDAYNRFFVRAAVINELGVVVGEGYDTQDDAVGFIWEPTEGLRPLASFGVEYIDVVAVNRLSQVVGEMTDDQDHIKAFIYDPLVGIKIFETLGGYTSKALDINDLSQVVGFSDTYRRSDSDHAFVWDEQRGMRDLNALIPDNTGWKVLNSAKKINNKGYILGEGIFRGEKMDFLLIPRK